MVLAGFVILVAGILAGRRLTPPERAVPQPLLAGLATTSLGAFALAGVGMALASGGLTGLAFATCGVTAGAFLWLARGGADDDDDGDQPLGDDPRVEGWRRYQTKRLTGRSRTRR